MDRKHLISGSIWLAVSIFVIIKAVDLDIGSLSSPGPGFIFFCSSMGLGILSFILILKSLLTGKEVIPLMAAWKDMKWSNAFWAVILLFLYALILKSLGYLLSTFILMIALFGLGRANYRIVILSALITSALSYAIFRYCLEVHLPRGIIGL